MLAWPGDRAFDEVVRVQERHGTVRRHGERVLAQAEIDDWPGRDVKPELLQRLCEELRVFLNFERRDVDIALRIARLHDHVERERALGVRLERAAIGGGDHDGAWPRAFLEPDDDVFL